MAEGSFTVETDKVGPDQWGEWLDKFQDANLYQTWAYGSVRWGESNLSHLVLKRDGLPVAMAQVRIVRPAKLNCGIAYLRWGPLCHLKDNDLDAGVVGRMAGALHSEYVRKRGLFLRILPNAFQETPRASAFQSAFSQFESEGLGSTDSPRTFVLDLAPSLPDLRKNLDQKWRNQLNRAEKNGLKLIEGDGPEQFDAFASIYDEMWARKRFEQSSDVREFARMQPKLPGRQRIRVLICEHEGKPAAGVVGTAMGDSGIYLFGATSDPGMKSKGSYLLQWRMITWLKENGARYYNLGGHNPKTNPGVYHFKEGFSGAELLYLKPLVACTSVISSVFARGGGLFKGKFRKTLNRLLSRAPGV